MKKSLLTLASVTVLFSGVALAEISQPTPHQKEMTMSEAVTTSKKIELVPGLLYEQIQPGTGESPQKGDKVSVHYVGTLENGKKFDSSRERGQPIAFKLGVGQVIQGWDKGIAALKVGERGILTISSELGYGEHGAGADIPGGATLIFDVELVSIN